MSLSDALQTLPPGVSDTLVLIAELDRCLVNGFAGRDPGHQTVLAALERIYRDTPLGAELLEAAAALARSEYQERHFTLIAVARASLQGALYDVLRIQAQQALGREIQDPIETWAQAESLPETSQVYLGAIRHWLMEVAMAGFARLSTSLLLPVMPTLEQLQADPLLVRQAALLTGTHNEWLSRVPIPQSSDVPAGRWADLWTRSMLGGVGNAPLSKPVPVTGVLTILGIAIHQHTHMVSLRIHAVLETGTEIRSVRLSRAAYKVDAIMGNEIWLLFQEAALLFEALATQRGLAVEEALLLPSGDLLWNGNGKLADPVDPFQVAARYERGATAPLSPPVAAFDRHPVHLGEPVFLENYTSREEEGNLLLDLGDGASLPVAKERLGALGEIGCPEIAASKRLFGLLCFDAGRWAIQPLMVEIPKPKGKVLRIQNGQAALEVLKNPPKNSTVTQLQERASRLLRDH
jgi:hypothetical protein